LPSTASIGNMEGMQVKPRGRGVYQITSVGPYSGARAVVPRRRKWPWAVGLVVVAVLAALGAGRFAWPSGALASDPVALAHVARPTLGGHLRLTAHVAGGAAIPVTLRSDGTVWPKDRIEPGTHVVVQAVFTRPGWAGWLAGHTQRSTIDVVAPVPQVQTRWLSVKAGEPVQVTFNRPVTELSLKGVRPNWIPLHHAARQAVLGRLGDAGIVGVSAKTRPWEKFSAPVDVTWFPPGKPRLLVSPSQGATISLETPLRLTASVPIKKLFGPHLPWLPPTFTGSWRQTDAHTLVFRPRGYGYGLDAKVKLRLPASVTVRSGASPTRLLTWSTPTGSQLRVQQILAQLGYLPLRWSPKGKVPAATQSAQVAAAVAPPSGTFSWRYGNVPDSLRALWRPGDWNVVTRGAVMAFQSDHNLLPDGYAGRDVWQALFAAAIAGKQSSDGGYSYVIVHRAGSPQSLTLWHDGSTILTTAANTGIPRAPTALGTYPVYAHLRTTTMSGTNPDGTKYHDPGVPWVSYFNGGDAIHGFNRASYGSAQSLGCVELPFSSAERVWPYTPIGTLVTVTD
jgi:peptidoglycan hydrolase-like protein with peptidoglycan-binding domain